MSILATLIGVVFSALAVLAALFLILDIVWDRRDKESVKQRILEFWIRTSNLALLAQVNQALEDRYARTRLLRRKFIILFWIFCGIVAGFASLETLWTKTDELRTVGSAALKVNFEVDFQIRCSYAKASTRSDSKNANTATHPDSEDDVGERCNPDNLSNNAPEIVHYRLTRDKFLNFVSQLSPTSLMLSSIISGLISVLIICVPATIALLISFNLTLWILSRITRSRIKFALLVLFDIAVAVWMPPFLISVMIVGFVAAEVLISGQIISVATFSEPSWLALTIGASLMVINFSFWFLAIAFLVISVFSVEFAAILTALAFLNAPFVMAALRLQSFMDDIVKVFKMDFSTNLVQAVIDYAIVTDLLFSIFYLGPCFLIVIANRNEKLREMFLNLVMWIGDHAKGPFVAMSELASLVFAVFRSGKR